MFAFSVLMKMRTVFDYESFQEDILNAGYSEESSVYSALSSLAYALDASEITDEDRSIVLQLFSSTGLRQLSGLSGHMQDSYAWSPFEIGNTTIDDIVRVKHDAYDSPSGSEHNGLVGRIESVFGGRVGVRYIGRYVDVAQGHPREKLEYLKRM